MKEREKPRETEETVAKTAATHTDTHTVKKDKHNYKEQRPIETHRQIQDQNI